MWPGLVLSSTVVEGSKLVWLATVVLQLKLFCLEGLSPKSRGEVRVKVPNTKGSDP